jgi:hypothetical protein
MSTKHDKAFGEHRFADDNQRNPGIGQTKGSFATGEKPGALAGENTVEGDTENDANAAGGVHEKSRERTND